MLRTLCKSKITNASISHKDLEYSGSLGIDKAVLDASDIMPGEQVHVLNAMNGERFTTYAIRAESGSRVISVNGAAAHKASPGDRVIICAYAAMDEAEADVFEPSLVYCNEHNQVLRTGHQIPAQVA